MKRWLWRILLALIALVALLGVSGVLVIRSDWFRQYLERRVIAVAERATGARMELGRLTVDWKNLTARVDSLVLHGTEPGGEAPFLRVDSAVVGLKIISVFERKVDLASLRVSRPQVRIVLNPDGSTNIPGPETRREDASWSAEFLNLKVGAYEIADGIFEYDNRKTPFHLRGENLGIRMVYDAIGPSYRGDFSSDGISVTPPGFQTIKSSVSTGFVLQRDQVLFNRMHVATTDTVVDLDGALENLRAPRGAFNLRATSAVREAVQMFSLPIERLGSATFAGRLNVSFENGFDYGLQGQLAASGLKFSQGNLQIDGARLTAQTDASPAGLRLRNFTLRALDAEVQGELSLARWRNLKVEGAISGLDMQRVAGMVFARPVPWKGMLAGTYSATATLGQANISARTNVTIIPSADGQPLEGHVELGYDQAAQTIVLGSTSLSTPATRVEFSGTLGRALRVQMRSTDLDDLLPALTMVQEDAPEMFPLKLNNGSVNLDGSVVGSLEDPQFQGQIAIVNGQVRDFPIDRFSAEVDATLRQILARNIIASRNGTQLTGSAALTARPSSDVGAAGGFADAEMTGQLNLRNMPIEEILRRVGSTVEATGVAAATVRVSGSLQRPEASVALDILNPQAFGEKADRVRAQVRYVPGELRVTDGVVTDGPAQIAFNSTYVHPLSGYQSGEVTFEAVSNSLPTNRLERAAQLRPSLVSTLNGRVSGTGRVDGGMFTLKVANIDVSARDLQVAGEEIGNLTITAETRGTELTMNAGGNIREAVVEAEGKWTLEGEMPGTANIRFTGLTIDTLYQLSRISSSTAATAAGERRTELDVAGFIEGGVSITAPLQRPETFRAAIALSALQLNPRPGQTFGLNVQPEDLIIKNSRPVAIDVTVDGANIRSAELTGRDTTMTVTGLVPFKEGSPARLSVNGTVNLLILQLFSSDLRARGVAGLQATISGNINNPDVAGRLSLNGASLELKDLPSAVENAAGTIAFDKNRATIEQLSAEVLGGKVNFRGFLEFGSSIAYRLSADARSVRLRYPADVYSTFDADLALIGTPSASTLSGVVTVRRASISERADLPVLLAQMTQPAVATEPNKYLSSVQLDVRITSDPNFSLNSALAANVEVDVDLRLRGSPERPALLGSIEINRGEMQLFGNRYTVERGDIRFLNPLRIEPNFDIDVTTRARGVTVNVSFSGTVDSLKYNLSSDPPLQQSEVVALLAVGRDPTSTTNQIAPGVGAGGAASFAEAGGGLLAQAASQQVSNRVQRFFGATRVKIDPTLTGVDNLPQARLTFEQQVSKNVTLTYITNLNRTTEQLVRLQWDLSSEWSAIAVRDQNGLFGIDFQFRKRF